MSRLSIAFLVPLMLLACGQVLADEYHIDAVLGDDVVGDGSTTAPWRTLTHAIQVAPTGAHRVWVHPGLYDESLGEVFPLQPPLEWTIESTDGSGATRFQGRSDQPVFRLVGGGNPFTNLIGLSIAGGQEGVRIEGPGTSEIRVFVIDCLIFGHQFAGIRTNDRVNVGIRGSVVSQSGYGWFHDGDSLSALSLIESSVRDNSLDGLHFDMRAQCSIVVLRSAISNNLGFGLWQQGHNQASTSSLISNSTVSFNAAGGVRSVSYVGCGGTCAPWTSVSLGESTVYGNGATTGYGGLERVGDSPFHFCVITTSISWGNLGLDNTNFDPSFSNIGTGHKTGPGMISGDPRFVDGPGRDFRLLPTSPCIDRLDGSGSSCYDHHDEPRPTDGNGDGDFKFDMGSDELHTFVAPGVPPVTGSPFYFIAGGPVTERGQLLTVLLSHDDGAKTGGIRLPGSGGLTVNLAPGLLFQTGLMLLPALQTTLRAERTTETPTVTLPPNPFDPNIYFAGVAFDIATGQYGHVTPTRTLTIQ